MARRALVVEDDALNRMYFCTLLEGDGFVVEGVGDERQTLDRAETFNPDLIVMDIQLPNVSGVTLIEALKAHPGLSHIPVLAVTGFVGEGDERRIREAGAGDYLPKPVAIRPFVEAVNRLVGSEPSPPQDSYASS